MGRVLACLLNSSGLINYLDVAYFSCGFKTKDHMFSFFNLRVVGAHGKSRDQGRRQQLVIINLCVVRFAIKNKRKII